MMKRMISLLLCIAMVCSMLPMQAFANSDEMELQTSENPGGICGDNLTWEFDADSGTLTISGTGDMREYAAMELAYPWLDYLQEIESVVVEENVSSIGKNAFYNAWNLVSVTLNEGLQKISDGAFIGCYALEEINIPESVTHIGKEAFYECIALESIDIPASVTHIGQNAFEFCNVLSGIWVDEDNAYYSSDECGVLFDKNKTTLIVAPGGLTGAYEIPSTVTDTGLYAFEECSVESVVVPGNLTVIGDQMFARCQKLTKVVIQEGVSEIGDYVFSRCSNLQEITIPRSVRRIGKITFNRCDSLSDVYYSGTEADWDKVFIGDANDSLNNATIHFAEDPGCDHNYIAEVTAPTCEEKGYTTYTCNCGDSYIDDEVEALGHGYGEWHTVTEAVCENDGQERRDCERCDHSETNVLPKLGHIYQDDICTRCGKRDSDAGIIAKGTCGNNLVWTFDDAGTLTISGTGMMNNYLSYSSAPWYDQRTSIKKVMIEEGVTSIGDRAFYKCSSLTSVTISEGVTSIGDWGFYDCSSLTSVTMPEGVISIGWGVFYGCSSLTSVTIPEGVTSIGEYAFFECSSLISVTIPNGVIGDNAFFGCSNLESVKISNSVTSIGACAFYDCDSLRSIFIPDKVTYIGYAPFGSCNRLEMIDVDINNSKYFSVDGVLYSNNGESLLQYPSGKKDTEYVLPYANCYIGYNAFSDCSYLMRIDLSGAFWIGDAAFSNCTNLSDLILPANVEFLMENGTFWGCNNLKNIYFGGTKEQWEGYYKDYVDPPEATVIHYNSTGPGTGHADLGHVHYFSKWDDTNQIAYFDTDPAVDFFNNGSQVTDETDKSFLDNVDNLLNNYVMVKTKPRTDGMIMANILISIEPLNSGVGTVTAKSTESISIDGIAYSLTQEDLLLDLISIGDTVRYHVYNGELVEIEILETVEMIFIDQVSVVCYANQYPADSSNESFRLCSGATVTVGDASYTTDGNGQVTIKGKKSDYVTFTKEGYKSRIFEIEQLKQDNAVYLQKDSDAPIVYGLWMEDTNILQEEVIVRYGSEEAFDIVPEIDWGDSSMRSLKLSQEANVMTLDDGVNSVQIAKYFDVGKDIILSATNENGKTATKILKIVGGPDSVFEGFSFEWGDKVEIVLPESAGILAGTKIAVDLYSRVPAEVVIEDGKFYASLGYQIDGKVDDKSGAFKGEIKNAVKDAQKMMELAKAVKANKGDMKQLWSELKNLSRKWVPVEGSLAVKGGASFVGFAEGYVGEDGLVFTNSGGVLLFTGGVTYTQPFTLPFAPTVPLFFELSLDGETEAMFNLFIDNELKEFTPKIKIENKVELGAGVGVGLPKVLSISGGGKGKLTTTMHFDRKALEYSKIVGALDVYVKLKLVLATFEKSWNLAESTWYEDPSPLSAAMAIGSDGESETQARGKADFYDASRYTIDDLSDLSDGSVFMGGGATYSRRSLNNDAPFVSDVYEGADPQTATFSDGTRLAVWIDYNDNYSGANALNLYYSYYNGSWSQPKVVEGDGTTDAYPDLKVINDTAYLVWQDASGNIGSDDTLDSIADRMDISGAVFDKEAEVFTSSAITSGSGMLNMQPRLCGDSNTVYVVWHRNGANDWFGQNYSNSLLCSSYVNGSWGATTTLYSGLGPLMDFDVTCSGGSCSVAYSMDGDGNLNTSEDVEVYLNGTAMTSNDYLDSGVAFSGTDLYWYSGGKLLRNGNDTMPEGVFIGSDRFQIINDHGVRAVVYAEEDGLASILYAAYYDASSGSWGAPIVLYNAGTSISAFSASATSEGEISVLIQNQEVTGDFDGTDPYGTVNLIWYNAPMGCDISVEDIRYANENYVLNNDIPVYITVSNTGELAVQKLKVEFVDANGTVVQTRIVNQSLLSGESEEITVLYHVTKIQQGESLIVKVLPVDLEDIFPEDNTDEMILSWDDVAVEDIRVGVAENNEIVIHASIVNRGYQPQSNITVTLRKGSPTGAVMNTFVVESLDALARHAISFVLDNTVDKIYYVTIDHKESDQNYANDSDFVNISAYLDDNDEIVEYIYGQNVQIKLIEPWGIRANAKISTSAGIVDYSQLFDYGAYFIRKSALDRAGLTQSTITVEDIVNDADARKMAKDNGVTVSSGYLSAIYDSDIYTYELDDSVFVMFYFITEEGADPIYVPVRERNLKDLAQQRMNDAVNFPNQLEREVYQKMTKLEADVANYRSDFVNLSAPEKQKAPTLAQYPLGAAAAGSSYSYGQNAQIKLIEPWGLKANVKVSQGGSVIDYNAVEEYGIVALADNSRTYADASEILQNGNAYVFSSKNGDATISSGYISATYSKDIFTYQLDTDIYVFGYVKDADGYHYGPVRNRNVHTLMEARMNDAVNFPNVKERTVYTDMIELFEAITAYREDYFKN